jgi:hypothetical protein
MPWPVSHSSASPISACPLVASRSMAASAASRAPTSTAAIASTGGVPTATRSTPSAGSYAVPMANWSRCPNHPRIGWRSSSCSSRRT